MNLRSFLPLCLASFFLNLANEAAEIRRHKKPEQAGVSSERLQVLRTLLDEQVRNGKVAGGVGLIYRRGGIVFEEAFGYQDLESKRPMPTNAIFRIASNTKPITCTAAMLLYQDGKFLLTDPISRFVPEFKEMRAQGPSFSSEATELATNQITILDLFRHTAGFATGSGSNRADRLFAQARPESREKTSAEMATTLASLPLKHQPGTVYEYGPSIGLLGRLVEVVSSKSLDEFFRERIFQPLQMQDTGYYLNPNQTNRVATWYRASSNGLVRADLGIPTEIPKRFSGSGSLYSTARDYLKIALLFTPDAPSHSPLTPKSVELMTRDQLNGLPAIDLIVGNGQGFGWTTISEGQLPGRPYSRGSFRRGGALGTECVIDPKEDLVLIFMTQVTPQPDLFERFTALAYQALLPEQPK